MIRNINFLAKDRKSREEMGQKGKKILENKFSSKVAVNQILDFYINETKKHPNLPS